MPANTTVAQMFIDRVAKTPNREAFRKPTLRVDGSHTWKETYDDAGADGRWLIALGLEPEQRVGIASNTRPTGSSLTSRSCCRQVPPPPSTRPRAKRMSCTSSATRTL